MWKETPRVRIPFAEDAWAWSRKQFGFYSCSGVQRLNLSAIAPPPHRNRQAQSSQAQA